MGPFYPEAGFRLFNQKPLLEIAFFPFSGWTWKFSPEAGLRNIKLNVFTLMRSNSVSMKSSLNGQRTAY